MPMQDYSVKAESSVKEVCAHLGKLVAAVKAGDVAGDIAALVAELPALIAAVPQLAPDFAESKIGFVKGANLGVYDILESLGVS